MAVITANAVTGNYNVGTSWVGGVAPTAADDAVIPAGAVITLPAATTCLGKSLTVQASGTLIWAATTSVLNLGTSTPGTGNVAVSVASGATITLTGVGTLGLISTSTTQQTITTNGATLPIVSITGVGSSYILSDGLTTAGAVSHANGTFNTNDKTCNWLNYASSVATARTFTPGASNITLTIASSAWSTSTITNYTLTTNTAVVTLTGSGASVTSATLNFNGMSFVMNGSGTMQWNAGSTASTVANLTRTGTATTTNGLTFGGPVTISGTFTCTGDSRINQMFLGSNTFDTSRTVSAATVVMTNTDIRDIAAAGAASWNFSAQNDIGDAQGNTGITFPAGINIYRVNESSPQHLYSDNTKWSTSSGGSGSTARVPLLQDTAIYDPNSAGTTMAVGFDIIRVGTQDYSLRTTGMGSIPTTGSPFTVYGSWIQPVSFTSNPTLLLTLAGRDGNYVITTSSSWSGGITINAPRATYTQGRTLTTGTAATLTLTAGTLNDGGFNNTFNFFVSTGTATRAIVMSGIWSTTATSSSTFWNVTSTGMTLTATGSTIRINNATGNPRTFAGAGLTYGNLTYIVAASTGTLVITGANTFNDMNVSDASGARNLQFTAGTTTVINGSWNVFGSAAGAITVKSVTAATHTLSMASGTVSTDYLNLSNSTATGGAAWYAGANSTNVTGNTGWIFTAPPSGSTNQNLMMLGVG